MPRINEKGSILIFDEAPETFRNARHGENCNKNGRRRAVMDALKVSIGEIELQQKFILLSSADLGNEQIDYVRSYNPESPLYLINNIYLPARGNLYIYKRGFSAETKRRTTDEQLLTEFLTDIYFRIELMGDRIAIPCDSIKKMQMIEGALQQKFPHLKIASISGENSGDKEIKEAMEDLDRWIAKHQPQVFLYTPTLNSGVSSTASEEWVVERRKLDEIKSRFDLAQMDDEDKSLLSELKTKIAQQQEITDETAKNWNNLTPYFNSVFALNSHLRAKDFKQLFARIRTEKIDKYICILKNQPAIVSGSNSILESEQRDYLFESAELKAEAEKAAIIRSGKENPNSLEKAEAFVDLVRAGGAEFAPEYKLFCSIQAGICCRASASQMLLT